MKRKPRKLVLHRETIRSLEDRSLSGVGGGNSWWVCTTYHGCSDQCDTDYECSTGCDTPTNLWYACG
jgi:hypothetical protein